jgi:hypothetical protein
VVRPAPIKDFLKRTLIPVPGFHGDENSSISDDCEFSGPRTERKEHDRSGVEPEEIHRIEVEPKVKV